MTPYKILRLFEIHKRFNPDKFDVQSRISENGEPLDDIDMALGGY